MWPNLVGLLVPWTCLAGPLVNSSPPPTGLDANDECSYDLIDRCSEGLIVYTVNATLDLKPDEIEEACRRHKKDLQCIQDFYDRDCIKGIAKAIFKASKEGMFDEMEAKCIKDTPRRKEYDDYVPCINKVGHTLRDCQRHLIQQFEAIDAHSTKKQRIPHGCCTADKFMKCVQKAIAGECSAQHVEYGISIVQNMSGNMLSTVCSTYEHGSEVCNRLPELPLEEPKSTTFMAPLFKALRPLG